MAREVFRLSWRVKLPMLLVTFATLPLALMALWTVNMVKESYAATTVQQVKAVASAKAAGVVQFTEDRKSEVERIAQLIAENVVSLETTRAKVDAQAPQGEVLPELEDAEALPLPVPSDEPRDAPSPNSVATPPDAEPYAPLEPQPAALDTLMRELRQQLGMILWDQQRFEELLVIAADGEVLTSTFGEHEDKTAAELDYFQHGLGATFVQPVFMSPITERLTMVISTPIRDESTQVVGVLAARLNLSRFFRLINDTVGLGRTGETVVGKRIGDSVVFMAPTRHDPDAALQRSVALDAKQGAGLQHAAQGGEGTGRLIDYRDHCTYAAWEHIPTLEWALVVKVDCEEALTPVTMLRERLIQLALAILALALSAAFIVARTLVKPLAELKSATDRISKGDFDVQLRIAPGDEVGDLAESFERMVTAIRFFRVHPGHNDDSLTPEELEERAMAEAEYADSQARSQPPSDSDE